MQLEPQGGGRFMPAPSRLTIITLKTQKKNSFDFLKLYNELGKVNFFRSVSFDLRVVKAVFLRVRVPKLFS